MKNEDELSKYLEKYDKRLTLLETKIDSSYLTDNILSYKEYDVNQYRIHLLNSKNGRRMTSLFFNNASSYINNCTCIYNFNPNIGLKFRIYEGKYISSFSTGVSTRRNTGYSKILIDDLKDKDTLFSLSTVHDNIFLMARFVKFYENLEILRTELSKNRMSYNNTNVQINLEDYRCILST